MPSSLQEAIQTIATLPVYSSNPNVDKKLTEISLTLSGNNATGQKLINEASALERKVNTFISSPLPGSRPSYTPASAAEQTQENGTGPSFSRK